MEREQVANTLLMPIDKTLGAAVWGLEKADLVPKVSGAFYNGMHKVLNAMFSKLNDLRVEGADHVPAEGGVLLASNHQSWLDVQILGAASPRRVHWIAKSEFETWPVLRHMVNLSESVFIHRGGDKKGLRDIVEALGKGWAVAIYPEGTIPGEEDVPRTAVEPDTGLLRGYTGVARMAWQTGVPIVPVGVSGTGRAFPPEVYPRLEILRMPGNTPVTIRFGEPITLDRWQGREESKELFREITDHVMGEISKLVDHSQNYLPLELPLEPLPKVEKLGVLLLHGFTSHLATVEGLVPHLKQAGIDYEMPVLRGHMGEPQDLRGVTHHHWYADAEAALEKLAARADKVVVVGLSMGGLVALELAMEHAEKLAGVVTAAGALRFADPLSRFTPLMKKVVNFWPSPNSFTDLELKKQVCKNYPRFATDAFASLYEYSKLIESRLGEVRVPIKVLQSKNDTVVAPEAANHIYEAVSSPHREIAWFERSGHELMQDLEADQVLASIMDFVGKFQPDSELSLQAE